MKAKIMTIVVLVLLISVLAIPINNALASNDNALDSILSRYGFTSSYSKRDLYDLEGNLYWLLEFSNQGYAICHLTANILSEFSLTDPSPYLGYTNIYYAGPSFYFYKNNNSFINIFSQETISSTESSTRSTSSSGDLTIVYNSFKNLANSSTTRAADTVYLVNDAYYFQKLTNHGTNTLGTCGQLAASILLSYYATYHNVNFVPSGDIVPLSGTTTNFQSWSTMPTLKDDLHQELIQITRDLDLDLATTGTSIKKILSEHYSRHTLGGVKQSVLTSPFFTDTSMRNILDKNRPLIMFGNLSLPSGSKGNHAVVCYGYRITSNVTYYRVHMGWYGYTSVELTNLWSQNIFGQIYSIEYTGNHVHSGNFIVNGTAYCGCGAATV